MIFREHISKEASFYYLVNEIEDLLDLNRFRLKRKFHSFNDLLFKGKGTEAVAKSTAEDIIEDFFGLVADSMIDDYDRYVFPVTDFGLMKVRTIHNPKNLDSFLAV